MFCVILDDNRQFCAQFASTLKKNHARRVEHTQNYDDAARLMGELFIRQDLPDIVFVDYQLGEERTGIDFIRHLWRDQVMVPCVLLTEHDDPALEAAAGEVGSRLIPKPRANSAELIRDVFLYTLAKWTEQRQKQDDEARKGGERVLALGAEIAHEMKGVIMAIQMQLVVLERRIGHSVEEDTYSDCYEHIRAKISDGAHLCDLLLQYGGRMGYRPVYRPVNIRTLIVKLLKDTAFDSSLNLTRDPPEVGSFSIDSSSLRHVLSVLLTNIIDHGGDDGRVEFGLRIAPLNGLPTLEIDVQDFGPGIPVGLRERVFQPGDRAGKEPNYDAGHGLGLGLGFARQLVESHERSGLRGSLRCIDSGYNLGARFRILLPG